MLGKGIRVDNARSLVLAENWETMEVQNAMLFEPPDKEFIAALQGLLLLFSITC